MDERTALIDADGLIYIVCYNKTLYDSDNVPYEKERKTLDECKIHIDNMITNMLLGTGATSYLLFLTVGKNFRYQIYPEYKANRKYSEKPEHFDRIKEYLITQHKALYYHALEADDLCLIYSKVIPNSFICSPDKDMLMLEGTHYNYTKNIWITTNKSEADYNFWTSMITGDTADNVKGIPGYGPKKAEMLLSEHKIDSSWMRFEVLENYILKFGEELGIEEFYKNYKVLKIRDKYEGVLPAASPIKFGVKTEEKDESEERDQW